MRQDAENLAMEDDAVPPADPPGPDLGKAVERLVLTLPPKERACVLLKDVFDYSLEEIAELVDSTVGGVKAAPYFSRYDQRTIPWRMAVGTVDEVPVVISFDQGPDGWTTRSIVRLEIVDRRIVDLRDYTHCRWIIPAATSFDVSLPA